MTQLIILAILAYVFFMIYRSYSRFQKQYFNPKAFEQFVLTKENLQKSELGLFVSLCAKVAKSDGRVDELEAETIGNMLNDISRLFPSPERTKELLKEIFNDAKEDISDIDMTASQLYVFIQRDKVKQQKMLEFIVNLAFINGTLTSTEEGVLRRIAAAFFVGDAELNTLLERFKGFYSSATTETDIDKAYATLGVSKTDDLNTIKKAYRTLVKQYHPDIIKAHGASDEYIQEATQKIQEINAAYEVVKKQKG